MTEKKVRKPTASKKAVIARKRNWMLFQVASGLSQLGNALAEIRRLQGLYAEDGQENAPFNNAYEDIQKAGDELCNAIAEVQWARNTIVHHCTLAKQAALYEKQYGEKL